jgi:hypothetical protein
MFLVWAKVKLVFAINQKQFFRTRQSHWHTSGDVSLNLPQVTDKMDIIIELKDPATHLSAHSPVAHCLVYALCQKQLQTKPVILDQF